MNRKWLPPVVIGASFAVLGIFPGARADDMIMTATPMSAQSPAAGSPGAAAVQNIMSNPFAPPTFTNLIAGGLAQVRTITLTGLKAPANFLDFKGMTPKGYDIEIFGPEGKRNTVSLAAGAADTWSGAVKADTDYIKVAYYVTDAKGNLREAMADVMVKSDASYALGFKVVVGEGSIIIAPTPGE